MPGTRTRLTRPAVVAIVGNPNCGKTTVFNRLTGGRQRVGNWPGVTVEHKTGSYSHGGQQTEVVDLPGTYSLGDGGTDAVDERIARDYLQQGNPDVVVNVIDASSVTRGLYLTTQLQELGAPVVVALNMTDVAASHGISVDHAALSRALGCAVVPLVASRGKGIATLRDAIATATHAIPAPTPSGKAESAAPAHAGDLARYRDIDALVEGVVRVASVRRTLTDMVDAVVLNRFLAFPIFLGVIYLMFMFTINVGSAFIDFFDIAGNAIFVEGPRAIYTSLGFPEWLSAFLADGVGGGIQLVGTFIPVIGCMFLALAVIEDSGYMARIAFVLDGLMQRVGLPGKSFVPLIVGFGCNVPAVMATRGLEREPDRILTTIMAPYMSCGARLTVYALFAAAFFPNNGQNVVFGLYLIGIGIAILSALAVRKYLLKHEVSHLAIELPSYHFPTIRGVLIHTWQRLKGFVLRAGKAIVAVVIILNIVSSVGTDGSFGHRDKDTSALAAIGRTITPALHPMGIDDDNWPATVGIFAGIFAKEVVVGTLDALYAVKQDDFAAFDFGDELTAAWGSVGDNLADLGATLADPLGVGVGNIAHTEAAASEQAVEINTIQAMRGLFHGELGAFSYLLFILLYMPCVATIGVIYKEIGAGWAVFSTAWSLAVAYAAAVLCYQIGSFGEHPVSSTIWILGITAFATAAFYGLIVFGRRFCRRQDLIPVTNLG